MPTTTIQIGAANDGASMAYLGYKNAPSTSDGVAWRRAKFQSGTGDPGAYYSAAVAAGGISGLSEISLGYNPAVFGRYEFVENYLRFDTSSLDSSSPITSATLILTSTSSKANTTTISSPYVQVRAGVTGGDDRPTFSNPPSNSSDITIGCAAAGGCGGTDCDNRGMAYVGTALYGDWNSGTVGSPGTQEIELFENNSAFTGISTPFEGFINRSGYTYIHLCTGSTYAIGDATICSNGSGSGTPNNAGFASSGSATEVSFPFIIGSVSGSYANAPKLVINQENKFQMII